MCLRRKGGSWKLLEDGVCTWGLQRIIRAEVEQQQQHESPPRVPHPPERPRRDVRPPVRLTYGGRGKPNVVQAGTQGTDASFNSVKADGTSIGGYVCLLGGGAVSWRSKKQNEVGLSSLKLAKNACLHGLTKHIRPKWHWVRRLLDKEVRLEIVKTHQQAADIFTKRLTEADHWKGMKLAGMSVH
ncbi:hypothetical protein CLOM_g18782 [Closterium sp. NIES-68]|nr:hypothetical protein CLOM_g18782 [Closterium sp. NIES-68]